MEGQVMNRWGKSEETHCRDAGMICSVWHTQMLMDQRFLEMLNCQHFLQAAGLLRFRQTQAYLMTFQGCLSSFSTIPSQISAAWLCSTDCSSSSSSNNNSKVPQAFGQWLHWFTSPTHSSKGMFSHTTGANWGWVGLFFFGQRGWLFSVFLAVWFTMLLYDSKTCSPRSHQRWCRPTHLLISSGNVGRRPSTPPEGGNQWEAW